MIPSEVKTEYISSAQNAKIKELSSLYEKSAKRKERGLFVIEGVREILHAVEAAYIPRTVFVSESLGNEAEISLEQLMSKIEKANPNCLRIDIPAFLYEKLAYRGSTEGIIAEMEAREHKLEDLELPEKPLVMVLEAVEKPGNLGAVLRSADAAAADAVIICEPLTDLYNPNLIRASIGAVFTVPTAICSSEDAIAFLKERNIRIFTAQLQDSDWYYDCDMKEGTALVMGTESTGLKQIWRDNADAHIKIPMLGSLDSLNVSVSAAILLFEAVRQRNG